MITSTSNRLVRRVRRLRMRKERDRQGVFFAEGIAVTLEALAAGAEVESIVVAPELLTSERAIGAVAEAARRGVPVTEVSADVFASIADRDGPAGLGAVVRTAPARPDDLPAPAGARFVALDEASNPGNLGTILRTADAAGCRGVLLCGRVADPFHPTAVKAAMGALFRIPVCRLDDIAGAIAWARSRRLPVVTTSAHAPTTIWDADLPDGGLYVFGSERRGLAPESVRAGDLAVSLPMKGAVSSLNLAVAAGVVLYEALRRRESSRTPT